MELDGILQGCWVQGLLLGFLILPDKEKLPKGFLRVAMSPWWPLLKVPSRFQRPGLKLHRHSSFSA